MLLIIHSAQGEERELNQRLQRETHLQEAESVIYVHDVQGELNNMRNKTIKLKVLKDEKDILKLRKGDIVETSGGLAVLVNKENGLIHLAQRSDDKNILTYNVDPYNSFLTGGRIDIENSGISEYEISAYDDEEKRQYHAFEKIINGGGL